MLILYNAKITTMNANIPQVTALAIEPLSGKIAAVGSDDFILGEFGARAEKNDMAGANILPGLMDAHIHLRFYALNLQKLNLFNISRQACIDLVAERTASLPPGDWVLGHGWAQTEWADSTFPTAGELDVIAPNHPVYLSATSLHAGWCNQVALQAAGVAASTPDPVNGAFGRDEHGNPNGMLFEAAMGVITNAIPSITDEQNVDALQIAQQTLWAMGITGVHDFDRLRSFAALQILHGRGGLKMRVQKHLPVEELDTILAAGLRSGFGNEMLWLGNIKAFADGALGPRTAAMLVGYENEPDNLGMLLMDREEIFEHGRKAALGGFGMTVHAIGDRANHEALAAFAQLRTFEVQAGLPAYRHRLEHAQILHPDDFAKIGEHKIIASVQPIHQTSDLIMADRYWGKRAQYSYAWKTLQQHGVVLAFGSDAPVDSPNPFAGLHAAVTRQRADGLPGPEGWYPEQRFDLHTALQGYTTGPAYTAGRETSLGQLARGYHADLIVLQEDIYQIPVADLHAVKPLRVMVGGAWVV